MKFRKHIRLKHYDYRTSGYYFLTICTYYRSPFLNDKKEWVEIWLRKLENRFTSTKLDWYVIMPDHIHLILYLNGNSPELPRLVQWFKSQTTFDAKRNFALNRLWQPNYYEHVMRSEKSLERIRKYTQNNPLKIEDLPWGELDSV